MAYYYLDLHECGDITVDDEGAEFADLGEARHKAVAAARDVMSSEVAAGKLCLGCAIVIRDRRGEKVLAVPFAEAVAVTFTK